VGTIVNHDALELRPVGPGVRTAALVAGAAEMGVTLLGVDPSGRYTATVPAGSDQYLFVVSGDVHVEGAGTRAAMAPRSFAIVEEGTTFTVSGGALPARVLSIAVPPPGVTREAQGFAKGLAVMAADDLPVVDLPEEKKRRIYLATKSTVGSERGHAMIVQYTGETVTRTHHHPNAESMFVMLDGRVRFVVNGTEETLGAGQAVHFPANDRHGLRSADGQALSFLEFHVPGAFVTRYD
jgi:mannose-6-phosphate isomerase-like protein (cupin superfamily)